MNIEQAAHKWFDLKRKLGTKPLDYFFAYGWTRELAEVEMKILSLIKSDAMENRTSEQINKAIQRHETVIINRNTDGAWEADAFSSWMDHSMRYASNDPHPDFLAFISAVTGTPRIELRTLDTSGNKLIELAMAYHIFLWSHTYPHASKNINRQRKPENQHLRYLLEKLEDDRYQVSFYDERELREHSGNWHFLKTPLFRDSPVFK